MNINAKHSSFMPALWDALAHVQGNVLELGTGVYSTFVLHWLCLYQKRHLVSYEHDLRYYKMVQHCYSDWHELYHVNDWDDADIERHWGIALVDHGPAPRRKVDIARLKDWARVVIVHDTQGAQRHHYHYEEVWPLFKYSKGYNLGRPHSVILSNFVDVSQW